MVAGSNKRWTAFASNTEGSIAMMFAVLFMTIAAAAGMAIDYSRATHMRARVAAAVDAASLAGGRALLDGRLTDAEVATLAREQFEANLRGLDGIFGTVGVPEIVVSRAAATVDIDVDATVPMTFSKLAGFDDALVIPLSSATKYDQRDVELGMALDVTGSMGGSKIADLRLAAKDLVDILLPDGGTNNTIRIGLAPYATSINAGDYAEQVTGVAGADCVFERGGVEAFTDAEPLGADALGQDGSTWCPSADVTAMTSDKSDLKTSIDGYNASGWTAGHLGIAWAWYLVSPEWASIWPSASEPVEYAESNTIKAVVLMTDGIFNTEYVGSNGDSSSQATDLCNEMKAKGVIVYSVAFRAPTAAQTLLQGCATAADTYFPASSGAELRASFQKIAMDLNQLRLTK